MDKEECIQKIIEAIQNLQVTSVRKASHLFGIPQATLQGQLTSTKSHAAAAAPYQKLTPDEEAFIVRVVLQLQCKGTR
ncbi:hypothetical protein GGR50DRAFT_230122 [Xylaria sp. CBS 124048]|nr:hypothetical protein GGR50DRAFT_230122 [Xylaria sp. CBS 124048]